MGFAKGREKTGGRPKGQPNKCTVDMRAIRNEIAASWHRADGCKILDKLAVDDPVAWANIVVKVLPKIVEADITHSDAFNDGVDRGPVFASFLDRCRERAGTSRVTQAIVLKELQAGHAGANGQTKSNGRHTK